MKIMRKSGVTPRSVSTWTAWAWVGWARVAGAAIPACAQTKAGGETNPKLNTPVHLLLGAATLPKITSALSTQTGLLIEAAEYLRARRLVVQMDDLTARDALNALTELNDWAWTDQGDGHILITRRLPLLPQEPTTIPRRMQAALPKDIRAYCRIKTPSEIHVTLGVPSSGDPQVDFKAQMEKFDAPNRAIEMVIQARQNLVDALQPALFDGTPFPYSRMAPAQQEDIVTSLLFRAISGSRDSLRNGVSLPYIAEPVRAFLKLDVTTLSINVMINPTSYSGFGIEFKP